MIGVLTQKNPYPSKNRWIACASVGRARSGMSRAVDHR
jgi:hypothetical protein